MSGSADPGRERDGLAFFSAIVASSTHELNNVLSIVDQVGGLLEDLAARVATGDAVDPSRLETLRGRIDRQVRKGVGIVHHLNNLAHSLDEPHASFDATETLEDVLALSERLVDLRQVRLQRTDWKDWSAAGDAFSYQRGVFEALRLVLAESTEGDRIEVDSRPDGGAGLVSISGTARSTVREEDREFGRLVEVMRALGGECRSETNDAGGTVLELRLPSAPDGER